MEFKPNVQMGFFQLEDTRLDLGKKEKKIQWKAPAQFLTTNSLLELGLV
jgi:hypothetical protein